MSQGLQVLNMSQGSAGPQHEPGSAGPHLGVDSLQGILLTYHM